MTKSQVETLSMFFGKVLSADDGEEAYWLYEEERPDIIPDIIIADIEMPKKSGLKLARMVRQKRLCDTYRLGDKLYRETYATRCSQSLSRWISG